MTPPAFLGITDSARRIADFSRVYNDSTVRRIADISRAHNDSTIRRIAEQQTKIARIFNDSTLQRIAEQQAQIARICDDSAFRHIAERLITHSAGLNRIAQLQSNFLRSFDRTLYNHLRDVHTQVSPLYTELQRSEPSFWADTHAEEGIDALIIPKLDAAELDAWTRRLGVLLLALDSLPPDLTGYGPLKLILLIILVDLELQRELTKRSLL